MSLDKILFGKRRIKQNRKAKLDISDKVLGE
jgi:hypothetical protein